MKFLPVGMRALVASQFIMVLSLIVLAFLAFSLGTMAYLVVEYDISTEYLTKPLLGSMIVLAMMYGFGRGGAYHPIFDEKYRSWLATTPWAPRHPLPKGPVQLVWADLVVVGVLTGIVYCIALTLSLPV
jgi:hypothetical protein